MPLYEAVKKTTDNDMRPNEEETLTVLSLVNQMHLFVGNLCVTKNMQIDRAARTYHKEKLALGRKQEVTECLYSNAFPGCCPSALSILSK